VSTSIDRSGRARATRCSVGTGARAVPKDATCGRRLPAIEPCFWCDVGGRVQARMLREAGVPIRAHRAHHFFADHVRDTVGRCVREREVVSRCGARSNGRAGPRAGAATARSRRSTTRLTSRRTIATRRPRLDVSTAGACNASSYGNDAGRNGASSTNSPSSRGPSHAATSRHGSEKRLSYVVLALIETSLNFERDGFR